VWLLWCVGRWIVHWSRLRHPKHVVQAYCNKEYIKYPCASRRTCNRIYIYDVRNHEHQISVQFRCLHKRSRKTVWRILCALVFRRGTVWIQASTLALLKEDFYRYPHSPARYDGILLWCRVLNAFQFTPYQSPYYRRCMTEAVTWTNFRCVILGYNWRNSLVFTSQVQRTVATLITAWEDAACASHTCDVREQRRSRRCSSLGLLTAL
jgi:hypothetical protein